MYIGIDNGGTSTRVAAFVEPSSGHYEVVGQFATKDVFDQQIEAIVKVINAGSFAAVNGIGIAIGAQVAVDGASVVDSVNLSDYVGKPVVDVLSREFGCPVRMAHDAVCGLLAERAFGHLRGQERCAYLTVSTGTGVAVHIGKAEVSQSFSIEMGHQIIGGNSLVCLCGQIGCLETITGGKQIELRTGRRAEEISDLEFWREFTETLAIGLVNLAQLTRVEAVTLSGGIGLHNEYLRSNLQGAVNNLIRGVSLQVSWATLGEAAPLVGAALLLRTPEEGILH
ncbi:ROK family protein [Catellatospora sp. NPDC049133]|uniref:ROK family protein n=1 Tax=Catellatospora sp. NPDC049133 TaxID=3155499 RepID=UPI0033D8B842